MASLNLSVNGPSIKSSYNGVVNAPAPTDSSPTACAWALFTVQAPLMSAFQDAGSKESILKVQDTGSGEIADLIEEFNEGRMQFAFLKVKDPNSGLPKHVLISWCGDGVPDRNKGLFSSHSNAVTKVLHGYHIQIHARSVDDVEPESILKKVATSSGANYSGASSSAAAPPRSAAPPPVKSKPVFTPTQSSSGGRSFDPLVAARRQRDTNVDADGWGADAPPVTRTGFEKVESAYKPTKVNMAELTSQKQEPSRFVAPARNDVPSDVVKGGYQPIGKVDIAALRAQAKEQQDDRPTVVKGAYEPVGKVDIAAIRARSQGHQQQQEESAPEPQQEEREEPPRPVTDRASAFSQQPTGGSERLTSLPKPKVANKFGSSANPSATKAPTPGQFGLLGPAGGPPTTVGSAGRSFADSAGKTPAQLWAEKKARERGDSVGSNSAPTPAPVQPQPSGSLQSQPSGGNKWQSGYSGKSWAPVQTSGQFGRPAPGAISQENTGEPVNRENQEEQQEESSSGGVSALKDRFKGAAPMGAGAAVAGAAAGAAAGAGVVAGAAVGVGAAAAYAATNEPEEEPEPEPEVDRAPPPVPSDSRPSGGFDLPSRPAPAEEEEEEQEPESPVRVAQPVGRGVPEPPSEAPEERAPMPIPVSSVPVPKEEDIIGDDEETGRVAAQAVAEQTFEPEQVAAAQTQQGGYKAVAQYDYEKAEDNEIDLVDGQLITNIEMVDEDWWMGTNSKGEVGLFPSNYVELVEGDDEPAAEEAAAPPPPPPAAPVPAAEPTPPPPAPAAASAGPTATALYDYEAAEDNELSFPEDAKITDLEFPDEDWWFGSYGGHKGLFPANYVQLDQ